MAEKKLRKIKSGPATPVAVVPTMPEPQDAFSRAEEKAKDPAMLVKDNPLVEETPEQATMDRIQRHNMERLYQDRHLRNKPGTGNVYSGIMSTRFGG